MNLFRNKDSFLSPELFAKLNATALSRYQTIAKEDVYARQNPKHPIRSREPQFPPRCTTLPVEIAVRYGAVSVEIVKLIREYLIEECFVQNPEIVNIWFIYYTNDRQLDWHCDGPVREFPVENCITTCLYAHDTWDEGWGGNIVAKSGERFSPVPNRLAIWSRDIIHMVEPITNSDPDYLRMVLATTWTSEGRKPNV
jgi:2OG-Fe(II) oxygenase superfamily